MLYTIYIITLAPPFPSPPFLWLCLQGYDACVPSRLYLCWYHCYISWALKDMILILSFLYMLSPWLSRTRYIYVHHCCLSDIYPELSGHLCLYLSSSPSSVIFVAMLFSSMLYYNQEYLLPI